MSNAIALVAPPVARPARGVRQRKAFSVVALRGKTVWPVAVAEFVGGEKIRMTCSMMAGRPWDFARARRLLAQTIGNERGFGSAIFAAATVDLDRKITAARALAEDRSISYQEARTVRAGIERLEQRRLAAVKEAQTEVLQAFSAKHGRVFAPATDFASFHLELDGERIEPTLALPKETRARLPKPTTPSKKGDVMGKHFNVSIRWQQDGVVSETVELVHASTTAIALRLARRAFYRTRSEAAKIESAEIVWPSPLAVDLARACVAMQEPTVEVSPLTLTQDEIESAPVGPSVATNVVNIHIRSATPIPALDKMIKPEAAPLPAPSAPAPAPAHNVAAAIAKLEAALGPEAVQAFLEGIDEFLAAPGKMKTWRDVAAREQVTFRLQVFKKGTGQVGFYGVDRRGAKTGAA